MSRLMPCQGTNSSSFPCVVILSTVRILTQFEVTSRAFLAGLYSYRNYRDRSFKVSESTVGVIAIVGKN